MGRYRTHLQRTPCPNRKARASSPKVEKESQVANDQEFLQLSLFGASPKAHINYIALYDLAPRFAQRNAKMAGTILTSIKREFPFGEELYKVTVTPARITDSDGNERDVLPGEREQLVEDVVRKFAAERLFLGSQNEVTAVFSVYAIQKELSRHNHTFSRQEIKEALQILHKSTIEITRVVDPKSKKPKPVLSAAAFPVLMFRDENDSESQASVQLNPLVAQGIKALVYEQVNYDWMMKIKGQLPRWVFKNVSLVLADNEANRNTVEIRASEIGNSSGSNWQRSRQMLAEVTKSIQKLKDLDVIEAFVATPVMAGKKKDDVIFSIQFSATFMADRRAARARAEYNRSQALKHAGTERPETFHPIAAEIATQIRLGANQQLPLLEGSLH
ncbi:hypothetical protein D3C71_256510 [compost metagenome]